MPITTEQLSRLEREHPDGLTMYQILGCLAQRGIRISEASFHRYVQLGLLPQSRRTGRGKGKHRGSRGLYPATAIRYLLEIRARLSTGETLAELHRDMQGTIAQDGLGARLARILAGLQQDVTEHSDLDEETRRKHLRELAAIEAKARVLMAQITRIGSTLRQDRRAKDRA